MLLCWSKTGLLADIIPCGWILGEGAPVHVALVGWVLCRSGSPVGVRMVGLPQPKSSGPLGPAGDHTPQRLSVPS